MVRIILVLVAAVPVLSFLLSCGDSPNNPFSPGNAKISLILKSSTFQESDTAVTDTVGKTIRLGLCLYLTQHIDSTVITIGTSPTHIDTVLKCTQKDHSIDTAYFDLVFSTSGARTVSAIAHVGKDLRQANAKIHVIVRPIPNRKPELAVTGQRTISAGQACTLKVSASDPDSGQKVTVDTLKSPRGSSFNDSVFIWQPTNADTGIDTVIFIARDNGSPVLTDTAIVPITVKLLKVNHPPTWSSDTVDLGGTVGVHISLTLADRCSDTDNDTLSFALLAGAPDGDTMQNGAYSFTPAPAHEGTFFPHIIARDPQQLSDTLVIKLTINPADTTPPTVRRISPSEDSATISALSCQIRVSATDKSGIYSVRCFRGVDSIPVSRSDTVYTATVIGILQNQYAKVTFIATDSSLNANSCTLSVYIKRDSTMVDAEGPVIIQKTGPASGSVITDPIIAITDSIIDPSGIDSVYWTLNGVRVGTMVPVSGSTTNYILRDTLSKYRTNRLVIHAIDRSARHNRDSAVVELDYNLPPKINDTAVAVDRNTAKTWTLSAQSQDNDSLFWSRLSSPSSLSGTVTGVMPSVTFTPATNWTGTDSFYVRVTDGYWSDTAKIKITVVDVPVAPDIVTQPQGLTRIFGQAAGFSVTINPDVNPAPTYQWKKNSNAITGANAASFSIGAVAIEDSGSYTVTVSNGAGTVTSQPALLTVQYAPVITTQPQSQTLYIGQSVTFTVAARGNPAPTYQWKKNGTAISGETGALYTISSPGIGDSGRYTVSVMNSIDTVESDTAGFFSKGKSVAAGIGFSFYLKTDGRLFSCGKNSNGQLGIGSFNDDSIPKLVTSDVQKVAAGDGHVLILKVNGDLYSCGSNYDGQLGDGSTTDRETPVNMMREIKDISAGSNHSLFLSIDGTLYGCGNNVSGALGDSTIPGDSFPDQIMVGVQKISAGGTHSLILKKDGVLLSCGVNTDGQLGDGTIKNKSAPVQVMTGVKDIAGGRGHSLILRNDGVLFSCGYNGDGELGTGTRARDSIPRQIMTGIQYIAASVSTSFSISTDGTLMGWGENIYGQLGDGTKSSRLSPIPISSEIQTVAGGNHHTLFVKKDGSFYACGANEYGECGDGTKNERLNPKEITF